MSFLDWVVLICYLIGMIGLSIACGRNQTTTADYYVGGRNLPWWALGISTMATQSSAISFISIPAFVALKEGGGLSWLQFELAVPLAMIFIIAIIMPYFRGLELISVFRYLELRFSEKTRNFLSIVFLVSRGFGTGIGVYATAIVLSVCLELQTWETILIIGVVTIVYDVIGGMAAVVYSDVIQMIVLFIGIGLCIYFVSSEVGGVGEIISALPQERWSALNVGEVGFFDEAKAPFWGFLFGGFFLYASYYGTDQSQAQRILSSPSIEDSGKALFFNGLARFPLTLAYLFLGMAAYAAYTKLPEFAANVPLDQKDELIPQLILYALPSGVRAVLFAALLAAAMSSLDSALNSISAVTMRDFVEKKWKLELNQQIKVGRIVTVIWGIIISLLAFLAESISDTVIEAVNKVGSAFYGPILAAFIMGILMPRVNSVGVIVGVLSGVLFNVFIWVKSVDIHWMWWNMLGFLITMPIAMLVSQFTRTPESDEKGQKYSAAALSEFITKPYWKKSYTLLVLYFLLILGTASLCTYYAHAR